MRRRRRNEQKKFLFFFFFFLFFSFLSYCRSFVKKAFVVVVGALNCDELALSTIDIDWTTINNLDSIRFDSIRFNSIQFN